LLDDVKNQDGHTIFPYTQLVESTDVSDKQMKVDSLHPMVHLVYLYPTNLDLPTTTQYKSIMVTLNKDYKKTTENINSIQPYKATVNMIQTQTDAATLVSA
jgi:hypothetical protein